MPKLETVPQKIQNELPRIKKNIENAYNWFKDNYKRYNEFIRYTFKEQMDSWYRTLMEAIGKSTMEFNVSEAFVSKLCGEYSMQEFSVIVLPDYDAPIDNKTIEVVEGHLRFILDEARKDGTTYEAFENELVGGYEVLKFWTEYAHPMSMNQVIKVGRVFSPTLVFFDPLATKAHKGDGRFCGELFPTELNDFQDEYKKINLNGVDFQRKNIDEKKVKSGHFDNFQWSYTNGKEKILLKCDYYEKKHRKTEIIQTADSIRFGKGQIMEMDNYKKFAEDWKNYGFPEPVPAIVGKPRITDIETICRYKLIENQILKYEETDYRIFPLIFVKGNSKKIQDTDQGATKEYTRSYLYNTKGIQDLMNFAGNSLGQELANIIQHQLTVPEEALPTQEEYKMAYKDTQHANLLVFKQYADKETNKQNMPPRVLERQPIPGQISETFVNAPQMIQGILGAYDASLVQQDNPVISGKAIVKGQTQANAASMPYLVSMKIAINRLLEGIVGLIPNYYVTPRTIPILDQEGKRKYQLINSNEPNSINMNYDPNVLQVRVEAGSSFANQQDESLQQIMGLSNAIPGFADFIQKKGLKFILDMLHIRGIDQLKELYEEYQMEMDQMQKQQAQMAQNAMQNNPAFMKERNKQLELQITAKKNQDNTSIEAGKLGALEQELEIKRMALAAEIENNQRQDVVQLDKHLAEKDRANVDLAIKQLELAHTREKDIAEAHHKKYKTNLDHLERVMSKTTKNINPEEEIESPKELSE